MVLGLSYDIIISLDGVHCGSLNKEYFIEGICFNFVGSKINIFRSEYPRLAGNSTYGSFEIATSVKKEEFPEKLFLGLKWLLFQQEKLQQESEDLQNVFPLYFPPKNKHAYARFKNEDIYSDKYDENGKLIYIGSENIPLYNKLIFESFVVTDSQEDIDKKMVDMRLFINRKHKEWNEEKEKKWSSMKIKIPKFEFLEN
jgi:hypothetical protein